MATALSTPAFFVRSKVDAWVPMAMDSFPAELAEVPAAIERRPGAVLPCPLAVVLPPVAVAWLPRGTAPLAAPGLGPLATHMRPGPASGRCAPRPRRATRLGGL